MAVHSYHIAVDINPPIPPDPTSMEAGVRAELIANHLSAIPKLDARRVVLDYVKSLRLFSKAHAIEGKAYMASWEGGEEGAGPATTRPPNSSGFATPVLKPRKPPAPEKSRTDAKRRTKDADNAKESAACLMSRGKHEEGSLPKSGDITNRKGSSVRRDARGAKRVRDLQSDEEKRLQERRKKKRVKRDIMRPKESKKSPEAKSKKPKIKLPAGLALMHGFTATNVGKHRLTIDPPFRSGVFSKGKASVQTRAGGSKRKDAKTKTVFSEEEFLKSARRRISCSTHSSSSASQSFQTTPESTEDQERSKQRFEIQKPSSSTGESYCEIKEPILVKSQQRQEGPAEKPRKASLRELSSQISENARSIVWDIEKDGGVLPTDSSSLPSRGPKPSTLLMNITQKKWIPDSPRNDRAPSIQDPLIGQPDVTNGVSHTPAATEQQRSPSVISSMGPSESPSQTKPVAASGAANPKETVSKYFTSHPHHSSPQIETPVESPVDKCEAEAPGPSEGAVAMPQEWRDTTVQSAAPKCEGSESEQEVRADENAAQCLLRGGSDCDWLLSDPMPGKPLIDGVEDGWFPVEESVETQSDVEEPVYDYFTLLDNHVFYLPQEPSICEDQPPLEGDSPYGHFSYDGVRVDDIYDDDDRLPQYRLDSGSLHMQTFLDPAVGDNEVDGLDGPFLLDSIDNISVESNSLTGRTSEESLGEVEVSEEAPLQFNEGRSLLLGCVEGSMHKSELGLESVEADVARRLVGHWAPQKY